MRLGLGIVEEDVFDLWWEQQLARLDSEGTMAAEFWTVKTAAFVVSKSENTVRAWFNEGKVNGVKPGGTILLLVSSLKRYLRDCGEY